MTLIRIQHVVRQLAAGLLAQKCRRRCTLVRIKHVATSRGFVVDWLAQKCSRCKKMTLVRIQHVVSGFGCGLVMSTMVVIVLATRVNHVVR